MRLLFQAATTLMLGAAVAGTTSPLVAQNRDRNLITQEELDQAAQRSPRLYDAVRTLRYHMVDTSQGAGRGVRSMDVGSMDGRTGETKMGQGTPQARAANSDRPRPILYIDGRRVGDLLLMRDLATTDIAEVKYYDRTRAPIEMGLGHEGGAILITTRKPAAP